MTINLTLAIEPSQALMKKIVSWFKKTAGPNLTLDINVDRSILGGMIVSYQGRYQDLSLKRKLDSRIANTFRP